MSAAQPGPAQPGPDHGGAGRASSAQRVAERLGGLLSERLPEAPLRLAPAPRRRAPRVPFVALVGAVLLGGILGLLVFNTHMQQGSFAAASLESRATALEARQQTLQMQIEDLRDPQRVARQARRLGMVSAGTPAFLDLADGSVLGDPSAASSADGLRIEPSKAKVPASLRPERIVIVDKSLLQRAASRRRAAAEGTTEQGADEGSRQAGDGSEGQDADE